MTVMVRWMEAGEGKGGGDYVAYDLHKIIHVSFEGVSGVQVEGREGLDVVRLPQCQHGRGGKGGSVNGFR